VQASANQVDLNVIQVHRTAVKQLADLKADLEHEEQSEENRNKEQEDLVSKWKLRLERIVAKVSEHFQDFYASMSCEGEIKLGVHEDFDKWGIEVWVSYRRGTPKHILTGSLQSGGERSVATMLFLLCLQHVTGTPFRVVDEINQGMDASNERMVFDRIVSSTLQGDTPQYFLITPKLLPDLVYSSAITVHFIFNGPAMVSEDEWTGRAAARGSQAPRRRGAAAAREDDDDDRDP